MQNSIDVVVLRRVMRAQAVKYIKKRTTLQNT